MKHISIGPNEVYFSLLRDHPFFCPVSSYFGLTMRSLDTSVEKTVLVRDMSAHPDSYQVFRITGATADQQENLAEAVVKLLPHGTFYLSVHPATGSTLASVDHSVTLYKGFINSKQ